MTKWRCVICQTEVDKTNKSRHLKSPKHIKNLNNNQHQEEQENDVFNFDDSLFEPTDKKKKFKCKKCH
jgi:DNA-directed RNA polymerase subunit RPC12/RpoP